MIVFFGCEFATRRRVLAGLDVIRGRVAADGDHPYNLQRRSRARERHAARYLVMLAELLLRLVIVYWILIYKKYKCVL